MGNSSYCTIRKTSFFSVWWEKAVTYGLVSAGSSAVLVFAYWWFSFDHVPHNLTGLLHIVDILLFALLSYVVWYQIINELLTWDAVLSMKKTSFVLARPGWRVALLTAFVPGKEPLDILERTLNAMVRVRYPHDTWVLDEGDDPKVRSLCRRLGVRHYTRKGKPEFNTAAGIFRTKTKGGNYNSWFAQYSYEYDIVAQHDVDFVPSKDYLNRTLGYFNDPHVAFVGTPQVYGNTHESWIARGAAQQGYGFYGPMQQGLCGHDMQLFIGANHAMRVKAHDDIEGYAGHIVEDHLTGMRLYAKRWKSVYVPEILLIGEGPTTWEAYFSQQMRWAFGLIDILFRFSPKLFPKMFLRHAIRYFLLQQYYFYGLAQGIGVFLISLYFFFGIQSASMKLMPLLTYYSLFLIFQIIIFLWIQRFYIDPEKESGLHISAKILNVAAWPIYLLAFISVLVNRQLPYQVTPKGSAQYFEKTSQVRNFFIHFIIGSITAFGILAAYLTQRAVPQLIFWAALNTALMYAFVLLAISDDLKIYLTEKSQSLSWGSQADTVLSRVSPLFNFIIITGLASWFVVVFATSTRWLQ
jgi:hypothetical protein